ncbi:hypothetical protein ACRALDRAFT_2058137 [Sodiomyces alcalophilus JCM 7366]|uniref:uncharacterized protein n=1 Tax=Sodiomyces alcalophilus JCM 7366 TaxID=591952 RepID=UPI0039B5C85E
MIAFLESEHSGAKDTRPPPRQARVQLFHDRVLHEAVVDLDRRVIVTKEALHGRHSYIDTEFMAKVADACLADQRVQEEIKSLNLPEGATVVVEPWAYATDGIKDMTERWTMGWFYLRLSDNPDANYYAYPLDICAEISPSLQVTDVYRLPSGANDKAHTQQKGFDRRRIHTTSEYHPDLVSERRTTTRPYHVSQPEGPSFTTEGNLIRWEKWTMRVGFNYREGMTLHDVRYDGRSLYYRLSLSEMFVPYSDTRAPYPRKAAFDLGNDGAGINANNLALGCDCLGHIKYFDGWLTTASGTPAQMPNAICCHEVDDGILWKHTNFRTGNAVVTRSRVLVLQTIITVSNYEYIFLFYFQQDASLFYEVRATGIMSTVPIDLGDSVPYGINVAPGAMAPNHQHLFCLRVDPAVGGHANSLVVDESHPLPPDEATNPFAVGFATVSRTVEAEAGLDLDFTTNRTFKIVNESQRNPVTGTPIGVKLVPCYSQMLLAHPSSFHARRAEYATHAVWVTRYRDDELFPAGRHTMQSLGGEGIASWIRERAEKGDAAESSVRDQDIVLWHTFGSTHNPRIEDWPVMPCDKMVVGLKPVNFFTSNPGLDVAISTQEKNRSVLVDGGSSCGQA